MRWIQEAVSTLLLLTLLLSYFYVTLLAELAVILQPIVQAAIQFWAPRNTFYSMVATIHVASFAPSATSQIILTISAICVISLAKIVQ